MDTNLAWERYAGLLSREVVPALGCTDPVAIALASSAARMALKREPDRIEVILSRNMLKNAMAVGIPGAGASGVDLAAALGAFGGDPAAGLRVLHGVVPADVERAKLFVREGRVTVALKDTSEALYIELRHVSGQHYSRAVIQGDYTTLTVLEADGRGIREPVQISSGIDAGPADEPAAGMDVRSIYEYAVGVPFESIRFILEAAGMNTRLSAEGLAGTYGLGIGRALFESLQAGSLKSDIATLAAAETAAAVDARMGGSFLPAMTNSGSGNQGIVATMPVVVVARERGSTDEDLARALILSHLVSIHIRQHFNRLSAMCGTIAAATGSACGMVYLAGGGYEQMAAAIANMAGDLTGMLCDGAKAGCALKASSAVQAAMKVTMLALRGIRVSGSDGIVNSDIERAIDNMGRLSSEGMNQADALILEMMLAK